ncbi:response regulator [Bdellovibrio sp. HCB337]|uniref:response regulator n=1 Tax=Bdellovibrio sp. HCB337 TaxID=3394358 RepID=UPI0039A5C352
MAFLVAAELLTLLFAMNTLSAVRAFVNGESLWSKAQKEAVISLHEYARTKDPNYYEKFFSHIDVILGDRNGREEMYGNDPYNYEYVSDSFKQGLNHPDDVPGLINLLDRFRNVIYVKEAVTLWSQADIMVDRLVILGQQLHLNIASGSSRDEIRATLNEIDAINSDLTIMESRFSTALGEGGRWLQNVLLLTLFLAVLAVETTGLILTFSITRGLTQRLRELNDGASKLGAGNLELQIPIRSQDDLGSLAETLNKMASDLKNSEKANRLKSLFLANMSHEMRTPLGAILGFTKLLQDPNLSRKEREEYVGFIEKTGESLTKIINDILDLSKVEAGYLEIEKHSFSLRALLKEVCVLCEAKLGKKQVSVLLDIKEPFPDYIHTDPQRLQQILMNLLSNAIKFTEHGFVKIECSSKGNSLCFRIRDSGVGIASDKQHLLFKTFSQIDNSLSRKHEGTGLGLVLSRHLARMLSGDVILESSTPGRGSTFTVNLPFEIPVEPQQEKQSQDATNLALSQVQGKSVLLVDDSEINRLLLNRILSNHKMLVTQADNGEEAIAKARSADYDVILMDVQMPIMDGRTATQTLRSTGYKKPIIALTAHAMKEDRDRCIEAGCNDYLTKPVDFELLFRTLAKYVV